MRGIKKFKILLFPTLLLYILFSFTSVASAKEGDFYKRHKKELDKWPIEERVEMIKKYDFENNEFTCDGFMDFDCKIEGAQFKMAIGAVKLAYGGISNFVITPSEVTGNSVFKNYKQSLAGFSTMMMAIFLMWNVMKIVASRYADATDGSVAINDKIILLVTGTILLGIYDDFFVWILQFQEILVGAVLKDPVKMDDIVMIIFRNGYDYGFIVAFMIMLIMMIFSIAFMYRFVLFGLLYVTGVIAIPTLLNDEYNYFSIWIRQLINNGVTLFLQALAFSLGFQALVKNNAFSQGATFSVAIAFFVLALTIPGILGQLGASSGSGRAIGSVVRYAARKK